MTRRGLLAIAALAGAAAVAGSYAAAGASEAFVVARIGSFVVTVTPGAVMTASITSLGDLASVLSFAAALSLSVLVYAGVVLVSIRLARHLDRSHGAALLAGAGAAMITIAITGAILRSIPPGLAVLAVVALAERGGPVVGWAVDFAPSRRRILGIAAGVAGFSLLSYFAHTGGDTSETTAALDLDEETRADVEAKLGEADEKSLDVPGMEPLVSEDFYEVDINSVNPRVDPSAWRLRVTGAVDSLSVFSYEDLLGMEPENRFITLRCVGEALNGHKMDNALWTGVPIERILDDVAIESDCECVMLRADDGYFEEFPIEALRRGFLAYGMNGAALPRRHGHPVRALIPGHWGEINVKWLTEIEFLEREADGFWEQRGWHGTGPVNTVAKLHAVNEGDDGSVQVGGHAYAGLRGVSAVQVSTDGGDTWEEATLSAPLPGEDVWRQWAFKFAPEREVEVVVRAVEADGTVQPEERAEAFPSGPSGWVSQTIYP